VLGLITLWHEKINKMLMEVRFGAKKGAKVFITNQSYKMHIVSILEKELTFVLSALSFVRLLVHRFCTELISDRASRQ
jgi:hypothetical protein